MLSAIFSKPYSRLFIVGDNSGWSTDVDARDLKSFADRAGVKARIIRRALFNLPQIVHYTSQFSLLLDIYKTNHRLSLDYYHGKPEQGESFRKCFEALREHKNQIAAVRVSTSEMEKRLSEILGPAKVMRIPIGVDLGLFQPRTEESRKARRLALGIPLDATVIGSFQKDGSGWGEGLEPKPIKGPDLFLQVVDSLKGQFPKLHVLLSGPSRGFMKAGLEKLGIPYTSVGYTAFDKIPDLYDALDLYLVTSREEGGPKAILESMAKGVPLVTTVVGQAADLVKNGQNAMMASIEDVEGLARHSAAVLSQPELQKSLAKEGFATARENSLENQLPLWKEYFAKLLSG